MKTLLGVPLVVALALVVPHEEELALGDGVVEARALHLQIVHYSEALEVALE